MVSEPGTAANVVTEAITSQAGNASEANPVATAGKAGTWTSMLEGITNSK